MREEWNALIAKVEGPDPAESGAMFIMILFGLRPCRIVFEHIKYHCQGCRKYFYPSYSGVGRYQRSSERFKKEVIDQHHKGIAQNQLSKDYRMGAATSAVVPCLFANKDT